MATRRPTGISAPNGDIWEFQDAKVGDLTQTGVTGATVAAQISQLNAEIGDVTNRLSGNFSTSLYTDFNDLPHGSIVQLLGQYAAHAPGNTVHYYIVFTYFIAGTTTYKLQIAIENIVGDIYTRNCVNGTWGNWNKFATT